MEQCPNGASEKKKSGQHCMPGLHCSTRRQTLLEEEALENLRVTKGNADMSHG